MVNGATAIRDSLIQQRTEDIRRMNGYDAARVASGVMRHTVGSLDNSLIVDTFDTNINVAQRQVPPSYGPYVMGAVEMAVKAYMGIPPDGSEMKGSKGAEIANYNQQKSSNPDFSQFSFKLDGSNMGGGSGGESGGSAGGFSDLFSW
jgi:hypothetical protein